MSDARLLSAEQLQDRRTWIDDHGLFAHIAAIEEQLQAAREVAKAFKAALEMECTCHSNPLGRCVLRDACAAKATEATPRDPLTPEMRIAAAEILRKVREIGADRETELLESAMRWPE